MSTVTGSCSLILGRVPKILCGPSSATSQLDVVWISHQLHPSWMLFGSDIKLAVTCTSVYARQVKGPHMGVNV